MKIFRWNMLIGSVLVFGSVINSAVWAELADINNAGFEAPYQGSEVLTGSFPVGNPPSGWQRYNENGVSISGSFTGVLNPGTQADYDADGAGFSPCFPDGAPEGDNVALLFKGGPGSSDEYGIEQELSIQLQDNMQYTLTVEVGNIQTCAGLPPGFRTNYVLDGFPGYRVELLAGDVVLAADENSLLPDEGTFSTSTFVYISEEGHSALGETISIRLVSLNNGVVAGNLEVDFDDVRLDVTPAIQVDIGYLPLFILMLVIIFTHLIKIRSEAYL